MRRDHETADGGKQGICIGLAGGVAWTEICETNFSYVAVFRGGIEMR
jgi:hypothetical protein